MKNEENNQKKEEKVEKYNYRNEDVIISKEEKEEEIKEVKEFNKMNIKVENLIHSLQISNENLRIRTLSKMEVNFCEFFCINIKNRIIFLNTFNGNYTYSASIKALCFPLYLLILLFVNTLIFICLNDELDYINYIKNNKGEFLWRCLIPIISVNLYFYLTRFF